jgi:hypothetical protein
MAYRLGYSDYLPSAAPLAPPVAPPTPESIPGGPSFGGFPQPPDVPCDPVGDGWRGPQGPQGLPGQSTAFYGASPPGDVLAPLWWDTVSGQLYIQYNDGSSTQWVVANSTIANGGPFLPITGGTVTGPLTLASTLKMGSVTATGFGVAPGLVPVWGNFQGGGNPSLTAPASTRMIFTAAAPATGDYGTVEVRRVTTYTGGAGGSVGALRVNTTVGAGDNNGEWNLIAATTTSSTGANATAVGAFLQGTRAAGTSAIWGGIADARDTTGLSSANGKAVLGMEIDVEANKLDDGTNANSVAGVGIRKGIQLVAFRYNKSDNTPAEVSNGLWFTCSDPTYPFYDSLIGVGTGTQARQALDTRGMVQVTGSTHPVYAVVMPHDHAIEFNAANTWDVVPACTLQYRAATQRLYYSVNGVDQWSIDASGNVRARGTVTGSTTP